MWRKGVCIKCKYVLISFNDGQHGSKVGSTVASFPHCAIDNKTL